MCYEKVYAQTLVQTSIDFSPCFEITVPSVLTQEISQAELPSACTPRSTEVPGSCVFGAQDWGSSCSQSFLAVGEASQWGAIAKAGPLLHAEKIYYQRYSSCYSYSTWWVHCMEEPASRVTPWTHIYHLSWRACIDFSSYSSILRHEVRVSEACNLSSACT